MCLPSNNSQKRHRIARIRALLHSDLQNDAVEFYSPEQDPDLDKWSQDLSHLLVPRSIPVFARHRWLTSADAVHILVLLSFTHRLLNRAIPVWLHGLKGVPVSSFRPRVDHDPWDSDGDDFDAPIALVPFEGATDGNMWAEFEAKQRVNSSKVATMDTAPLGLVAAVSLQPQIGLMNGMLKLGSGGQHAKEQAKATTGAAFVPRLSQWYSGELVRQFSKDAQQALGDPSKYALLQASHRIRKHSALAAGMVLRAVGGVAQLLPRSTYPWKLWGLLLPGADALAADISRDARCLRCPFSQQVCTRFSSPEALLSLECRTLLLTVGQVARLEISALECRHAAIRRWGRARSQTHAECIRRASAAFVLLRHKVCQSGFWSKPSEGPKRRPRPRCPGAGPQRLSCGRFLKGRAMKTVEQRRQAFLEANRLFRMAKEQGGDVYDELVRTGFVGKQARLAGGEAFGGGRRQRQRTEDS